MLATIYASRLLQLHIFTLPYLLSLNSLDREGARLLSPCGSQILRKTSLQVPLNRAVDATKLKEELDEDLVLYVVPFSSWSVVEPSRDDRGSV